MKESHTYFILYDEVSAILSGDQWKFEVWNAEFIECKTNGEDMKEDELVTKIFEDIKDICENYLGDSTRYRPRYIH